MFKGLKHMFCYKYERVNAHGPRDTRGTHLLDVDFLCSMMFHFCLGYSFAFTDHHNSVLYFYTYDSYDMSWKRFDLGCKHLLIDV